MSFSHANVCVLVTAILPPEPSCTAGGVTPWGGLSRGTIRGGSPYHPAPSIPSLPCPARPSRAVFFRRVHPNLGSFTYGHRVTPKSPCASVFAPSSPTPTYSPYAAPPPCAMLFHTHAPSFTYDRHVTLWFCPPPPVASPPHRRFLVGCSSSFM